MVSKFLAFLLCLTTAGQAADWTLPAANQGAWLPGTDVGVVGGIDQYRVGGASARTNIINVTASPYNADNTGATACQTAIQAAIDAAASGDVVYFPAGTYKITASVYINHEDTGITLRGDGASTIFYGSGGTDLAMFDFVGGNAPAEDVQTVTGTKTKGTTALSVASSAAYGVGDLIALKVENEENNTRIQAGAPPTWSHSAFSQLRNMMVKVTAVSSGVVTVDPPLPWDCTNYAVTLYRSNTNWAIRKVGFEDMSVTFDAAAHPLYFIQTARCDECWFYNITAPEWKKNSSNGAIIHLSAAYRGEIRYCDFRTLAPASYTDDGAIEMVLASKCAIIDNILHGWDYAPYNSGNTYNNVIAYNYIGDSSLFPGHNGHNSLDLIEGNVCQFVHFDGYHGSNSHMTIYRNWITRGLLLKRFQYYMISAGNVMGRPGVEDASNSYGLPHIGNESYTGNANPFTGDFHADWGMTGTLTTKTTDANGVLTAVGGDWATAGGGDSAYVSMRWASGAKRRALITNIAGQVITFTEAPDGYGDALPASGTALSWVSIFGGYNELDGGVDYTLTRAENFLALSAGGGSLENATADVLPNSLAYTSKPAFFGALAWPPVEPNSPTYSVEIIPAGYRFVNDVAPDPDPAPSGPTITTGALSIGGTLSIGN